MQSDYRAWEGVRPCRHEPACRRAGEVPGRLFLCLACRAQVLICSHCDRGHVYCAMGCAQKARRRSLRAAGRRYQTSRRGSSAARFDRQAWRKKICRRPDRCPSGPPRQKRVDSGKGQDRTLAPRWQSFARKTANLNPKSGCRQPVRMGSDKRNSYRTIYLQRLILRPKQGTRSNAATLSLSALGSDRRLCRPCRRLITVSTLERG